MIKTVAEFAQACVGLNGDAIYELFENGCTEHVRDGIYDVLPADSSHIPEPTRFSLNALGEACNVQSLKDY